MVLHNCPTAEIWRGNTLSTPHFVNNDGSLKTFDFVVANPHFSNKAWSTGFDPHNDLFHRFDVGVPPDKNGDYAYLLHVIASLKSTGKGAIILPHGVLFRGNVEAEIREKIVEKGYIKGIIGLPANLFYGTGIPACIVVLDKENVHRDFRKDDADKFEKYQAEALIYRHVPVSALLGIACQNDSVRAAVQSAANDNGVAVPVQTRAGWYL